MKSVILRPSFGFTVPGPGWYEISGLAWSGAGKVAKVEVSADGGASWSEALLEEPVRSQALTRFRMPWAWDGGPVRLQSRATDEHGDIQGTREAWYAQYRPVQIYHYNAIQTWQVNESGEVSNVYV